jgi:signal transduction histidine kinase
MSTLGEELISNERVALTELVKNAYDADANLVVIRFVDPLEEGTGAIEVWDNGHGMTPETVRGTWMEIATPHRHRAALSEGLGRRVLGAKGIGRFAAARLASTMVLTSRRRDGGEEVSVRIDWGEFSDEDAYLDQVPVEWRVDEPDVFAPGAAAQQLYDDVTSVFRNPQSPTGPHGDGELGPHGTVVRMEGLRQAWDARSIERLKLTLSRLLPPPPPAELSVPDRPEFAVYVAAPQGELRHLSGFVAPSEALAHPHYRLVGNIDDVGEAVLSLRIGLDAEEMVIRENVREESNRPSCGPIVLDIRAWDLDARSLKDLLNLDVGATNSTELKKLIRGNSGVALYRDGFRVQPYGEVGYDWLGFDLRRVNNPTMRLSNNQVAGFVHITADDNPGLQDRSHREGLIDTPQYEELRSRITRAVARLEVWRHSRRSRSSEGSRSSLEAQPDRGRGVFESFNLAPLHDVVSSRYPDDVELGRAVEEATETITTGVKKVQEILSRFSRLATLGTLVDVVLHDGRSALSRIGFDLWKLNKVVKRLQEDDQDLSRELEKLHVSFLAQEKALDRLFTRIEPMGGGRRRGKPLEISLHEAIRDAVSVHEPAIAKHNIALTIGGEDVTVTAEPGDINALVINLVGNAIYWLATLQESAVRAIRIDTERLDDGNVDITVSDSGPGVRQEIKDTIFEPYVTDKPDGIGLGLSIAGTIVKDFYDGDLSLVAPGPLPGACFRARLRRRVG